MSNIGGSGRNFFKLNVFYRIIGNIKFVPPMIRDYLRGKYRKVPYWTFGGILLAVLYVLSPLDAIPDYILGLGQIDDALVIWLCLLIMERDIVAYKRWKMDLRS